MSGFCLGVGQSITNIIQIFTHLVFFTTALSGTCFIVYIVSTVFSIDNRHKWMTLLKPFLIHQITIFLTLSRIHPLSFKSLVFNTHFLFRASPQIFHICLFLKPKQLLLAIVHHFSFKLTSFQLIRLTKLFNLFLNVSCFINYLIFNIAIFHIDCHNKFWRSDFGVIQIQY